ncbi:HD-GYP domain, c-di-GMP phosphodiesterase class II (or its inactivated variant) [Peptoclostridium litorale DSM 5388]|uniref:HD-GYP hydrolase domain-containing protein n=1 Tax=Peptoclostridium litorale DSM 5388 TaxID=1121324 RepID=A0A069RD98_PEPLI|nr:HD-GYP domain-containing protein [Peptoclostridium litorale]KDR94738.1 HD-GYP hydrolase domain-containing protein [Peptoclostridium litorale DSM 5388]SIN91599.1 HD-GYP domain, c-di-GMP phosphodiesterase class II (or its inactivated variant) [Peptoclostridium litorale DSM 5388]
MRFVPMNSVRKGAVIAKPLIDSNGSLLLKEGVILSDPIIQKIQDKGYKSIYVKDDYSQGDIEDVIKPEIRRKVTNKIKDTFEFFAKNQGRETQNSAQIYKNLDELYDMSKAIVDDLFNQKDIMISMVDIKSMDNYTYSHSVNVAVLSLVIGIAAQLTKNELYEITMGAMLHDIGKIFVPKEILNKPGKLTDEEFKIIQQHTVKGYEYISQNSSIKATTKIIALQHHLNMDGSGYPSGNKLSQIHKFSRIVSIADIYDALTSDRSYRKAFAPSEAIEYIMSLASSKLDIDYVKVFVKKIIPYPVGTIVMLSNGETAVVKKLNEGFPMRPVVELIINGKLTDEKIDLMEMNNQVIKEIVYEISG